MSVHTPLPITIVQMGHVEKLAEVAQNQTTVQQQVTQEETARRMREKYVDPTQPATQAKVGDDGGPNRQDFQGQERQSKRHTATEQETEQPDEPSHPKDPFTGIIVNIKV